MRTRSRFAKVLSPMLPALSLIRAASRPARNKSVSFKPALIAPMWAMLVLTACGITAHAQDSATGDQRAAGKGLATQANGPNLPVLGSGTAGQLTKWTGLTAGNSYVGDSIITETKYAQIGIGTTTPTSKLTVAGPIETTTGGVKFPDGTVQTTAFTLASSVAPQPFQQALSASFSPGLFSTNASITVPAGKRLVIETASLRASLAAGQTVVSFILTTTVGGQTVDYNLFPVSAPSGGANLSDYGITQPLKVYADPGTQITASIVRSDASGGGVPIGFNLGISGYLQDAQ